MEDKFFDIRPYTDSEAQDAFKRISEDPALDYISRYLNPEASPAEMRGLIGSLTSVKEFQHKFMYGAVKSIIKKTANTLTSNGIHYLKDGKCHLLISNHRDIILDPAIIQALLYENSIHTTEIAVGDNLISSKFIEDVTRSNGMIRVVRGGSPREIYHHSTHLSEYLRLKIGGEMCSAWIAQRNGRTKDGIDQTSQGLLKMLLMSGTGDFAVDINSLNILPISISYQYEPCDFLKAREIYYSRRVQYKKMPGEDLNSILTGLTQNKGNIHFEFLSPLSSAEIKQCADLDKNDRFQALSKLIDKKIILNYKLWNNNYLSNDILNNTSIYSSHYTEEDKRCFISYMESGLNDIVEKESNIDYNELREIFLSIYANPVNSYKSLSTSCK